MVVKCNQIKFSIRASSTVLHSLSTGVNNYTRWKAHYWLCGMKFILTNGEHAAQRKGQKTYCRFKSSRKLYIIIFSRKKTTDDDSITSYLDKMSPRLMNTPTHPLLGTYTPFCLYSLFPTTFTLFLSISTTAFAIYLPFLKQELFSDCTACKILNTLCKTCMQYLKLFQIVNEYKRFKVSFQKRITPLYERTFLPCISDIIHRASKQRPSTNWLEKEEISPLICLVHNCPKPRIIA